MGKRRERNLGNEFLDMLKPTSLAKKVAKKSAGAFVNILKFGGKKLKAGLKSGGAKLGKSLEGQVRKRGKQMRDQMKKRGNQLRRKMKETAIEQGRGMKQRMRNAGRDLRSGAKRAAKRGMKGAGRMIHELEGELEEGARQGMKGAKKMMHDMEEEIEKESFADANSKLVIWRKTFEDKGLAIGQVYNDWATLMLMGLNIFTFLLAFMVFIKSIMIAVLLRSQCLNLLLSNAVTTGFLFSCVLMIVSAAGFFGVWFNRLGIVRIQFFLSIALVIFLFCFTIHGFRVTSRGKGQKLPDGIDFELYTLSSYSTNLQTKVNNPVIWKETASCLRKGSFCKDWASKTPQDLYSAKLTSTQLGCCAPPFPCGYVYEGGTTWTLPSGSTNDQDCRIWDNNPDALCYDCSGCKAGLLQNVKSLWYRALIINAVAMPVLMFIIYRTWFVMRKSGRWKSVAVTVKEAVTKKKKAGSEEDESVIDIGEDVESDENRDEEEEKALLFPDLIESDDDEKSSKTSKKKTTKNEKKGKKGTESAKGKKKGKQSDDDGTKGKKKGKKSEDEDTKPKKGKKKAKKAEAEDTKSNKGKKQNKGKKGKTTEDESEDEAESESEDDNKKGKKKSKNQKGNTKEAESTKGSSKGKRKQSKSPEPKSKSPKGKKTGDDSQQTLPMGLLAPNPLMMMSPWMSPEAAFLQGGTDPGFLQQQMLIPGQSPGGQMPMFQMDPYGQQMVAFDPNVQGFMQQPDPYAMYTESQNQMYAPDPMMQAQGGAQGYYSDPSQAYDPYGYGAAQDPSQAGYTDQSYYSDPNQAAYDPNQAAYDPNQAYTNQAAYQDPNQAAYQDPNQAAYQDPSQAGYSQDPYYNQSWQQY